MAESPPPLASRRILIVDDQPSIRGVLQVALEEAGADVWTAGDGPSALLLLESSVPDVILLDLEMPNMDGWAVIEALRAAPRTAHIPVVLVTGTKDYRSFTRARGLGIAAFVSKPFRLNEVVETGRRILDGARPLQGRVEREAEGPAVQVRESTGALVGIGKLLDLDARGAQVDFERPLATGQLVTLLFAESGGSEARQAEVRWVRKVGEGFHHGFRFPGGG
ncbi:MAG TPA: response regulator [Vicinamibacteria bacterium]|nr:response regulator [Vicinamibacteria bacterium]